MFIDKSTGYEDLIGSHELRSRAADATLLFGQQGEAWRLLNQSDKGGAGEVQDSSGVQLPPIALPITRCALPETVRVTELRCPGRNYTVLLHDMSGSY